MPNIRVDISPTRWNWQGHTRTYRETSYSARAVTDVTIILTRVALQPRNSWITMSTPAWLLMLRLLASAEYQRPLHLLCKMKESLSFTNTNFIYLHHFIVGRRWKMLIPFDVSWDIWNSARQRSFHNDVIKWKHFPRYWPFVRGIRPSPVNSTKKANDAELWCFLWSAPQQTVE